MFSVRPGMCCGQVEISLSCVKTATAVAETIQRLFFFFFLSDSDVTAKMTQTKPSVPVWESTEISLSVLVYLSATEGFHS